MNKIFLTLISFFIVEVAYGQEVNATADKTTANAPVLQAVDSVIVKPTADEVFAEAERNERSGKLDEALILFKKAAFEYNLKKQRIKYGSTLLRMSNLHLALKNLVEAEQVAPNLALKNYSRIGSSAGQMETYNMLAKIYFEANKLPQSLWFYSQQGMSAQRLNNKASYIESVLGIAAIKIKKQEYYLAIKDVNRAEILAKNSNINKFAGQIQQSRNAIAQKNRPKI